MSLLAFFFVPHQTFWVGRATVCVGVHTRVDMCVMRPDLRECDSTDSRLGVLCCLLPQPSGWLFDKKFHGWELATHPTIE
jgi:hypothetical protein